jgi:hypothetical protein
MLAAEYGHIDLCEHLLDEERLEDKTKVSNLLDPMRT